jgi:hypothetical protein
MAKGKNARMKYTNARQARRAKDAAFESKEAQVLQVGAAEGKHSRQNGAPAVPELNRVS